MKFVAITEEELAKKCPYKKMQALVREFMSMNIKIARVDFDEHDYKNTKSACGSFSRAIKDGGFPISVKMIDKELYLIRKDI